MPWGMVITDEDVTMGHPQPNTLPRESERVSVQRLNGGGFGY